MSQYFVELAPDGRVARWSSSPIEGSDFTIPAELDPAEHYFDGADWVSLPPPPNPHAEFDPTTGVWTDPRPLVEQMSETSRAAILRVNETVGQIRRRYITTIPGQEMVYQAKEAEAKDYVALATAPAALDDFPLLAAEVGITAPTAYELAQLWLNMAAQWRGIAAQLETLRLGTIGAMEDAETRAEIETALASFTSGLGAFA